MVTHAHADHLHGIDDLRSVNRLMRRPIPLYADAKTLADIGRRFGYVFDRRSSPGRFYKPTLAPHEIGGPFEIAGIPIVPFAQDHGFSTTLGLRIGGLAYSTDVTELDEAAFAAVEGSSCGSSIASGASRIRRTVILRRPCRGSPGCVRGAPC